jgi:hypothetical protein
VKDLQHWDEAPLWQLNWALGRPPRLARVPEPQMTSITARTTLIKQAGLSLAVRCQQTNAKFSTEISVPDFRRIYKSAKITRQKMKKYMGPPKPVAVTLQRQQIRNIQQEIREKTSRGWLLI